MDKEPKRSGRRWWADPLVITALLVCAILSWLAIELMSRWYARTRTAGGIAAIP